MNIVRKVLSRIGHFLLTVLRVLRRAICCRRRKDDNLLPMTVSQMTGVESLKVNATYELQSGWDAWPDIEGKPFSKNSPGSQENTPSYEDEEENDFFKDMVPQIRKPKKIYIKKYEQEREEFVPNRLAMDPKAILTGPDLGVIDDNPSNWEDIEDSSGAWDPNQLIRETKRAEREKRLAEHQRRKQERESRRASRQDSSGISLNIIAPDQTSQNSFA